MKNIDVIKKLIGDIRPQGDSSIDQERLANMKAMCELVDELISEISRVSHQYKNNHEHSIKQIVKYANDCLTELSDAIEFSEWKDKNYSGSPFLGFYKSPDGIERYTTKELYEQFKLSK